jgi:hypothetical protein
VSEITFAGINGERAQAIWDVLRFEMPKALGAYEISQHPLLDRESFSVSSPYETTQNLLRAMLERDMVKRRRGAGNQWLYWIDTLDEGSSVL